jgi:hypothetical protein
MPDIPIIRGEYHLIENRLHFEPKAERTDPIAKAHHALVRELSRIEIPRIAVSPEPEHFEAVADYIRRVTDLFDVTWLQAIGAEVASNALCTVDQKMFTGQFVGAIDGNATYELDACAEAAREAQLSEDDDEADDRYDDRHAFP